MNNEEEHLQRIEQLNKLIEEETDPMKKKYFGWNRYLYSFTYQCPQIKKILYYDFESEVAMSSHDDFKPENKEEIEKIKMKCFYKGVCQAGCKCVTEGVTLGENRFLFKRYEEKYDILVFWDNVFVYYSKFKFLLIAKGESKWIDDFDYFSQLIASIEDSYSAR